jgi:4-carboxymuconolactone decarboxylase
MMAGIPLVSPPYDPKVAEVMDKVTFTTLSPVNLMRSLANHPRIFSNTMTLGGTLLLRTSLDARLRELAILRTAARTRSEYEWGMHVSLFRESCRLSEPELTSLQKGIPEDSCWSDDERLVLHVVDEIHDTSTLTDATWSALATAYAPGAIVELIITIGNYHMVAFFLNACRVPLEPAAERFKV